MTEQIDYIVSAEEEVAREVKAQQTFFTKEDGKTQYTVPLVEEVSQQLLALSEHPNTPYEDLNKITNVLRERVEQGISTSASMDLRKDDLFLKGIVEIGDQLEAIMGGLYKEK